MSEGRSKADGPVLDQVRPLAAPLEELYSKRSVFPDELLRDGETGLCLFAAAFMGINDAIHMAKRGMTVTCVDLDDERLGAMSFKYPHYWKFVPENAWRFAGDALARGAMWDVVSVDTFCGHDTRNALPDLPLWCSIANRVVLATVEPHSTWTVPGGWHELGVMKRSPTASWLMLGRDS